jgi:flagellar motor switch/type III secretory pathway protein FliN
VSPRKRKEMPTDRQAAEAQAAPEQIRNLSGHRQKLLGLRVPLAVTLVSARRSVAELSNMAPGTILRFDTPCSAALELQVAGRTFAHGQCVRSGDRLGLLIGERSRSAGSD